MSGLGNIGIFDEFFMPGRQDDHLWGGAGKMCVKAPVSAFVSMCM